MKFTVPTHYTVARAVHPYDQASVVERGGEVQRVRLELPKTADFVKKFGRRIKKANGNYWTVEHTKILSVHFELTTSSVKLLQDLIIYHWHDADRQFVTFDVSGPGASPPDNYAPRPGRKYADVRALPDGGRDTNIRSEQE